MPSLAQGFRRLTWVGSVVFAVPWAVLGFADQSNAGLWFSIAAGAFGLSWVVFFAALWVARGFSSQQTSRVPTEEGAPKVAATVPPKECPRCGLTNPPASARCDCGYDFKSVDADLQRNSATEKQRTNWLWPKIVDEASAGTAANEAVGYAVVVAVFTAGIATASVISGHPIVGFDAWNYFDAALVGIVAFGLWKRSRVAAVAGVLYWFLSAGVKIADGERFGIITVFVLLGFIHGIRGTFALAKYREARSKPAVTT